MKVLRIFSFVCLISLFLSSCASVKGGGAFGKETLKYNELASRAAQNTLEISKNETGFYFGVGIDDLEIADRLEFQPEAIKDLNQIQVPLLLSYEIVDDLSVQIGPNFGILLDAPDSFNSFNFGADGGLSYNITEELAVEGRYNLGISNLLDGGDSDNSVRINVLSFGLRYSLDFLKGDQ